MTAYPLNRRRRRVRIVQDFKYIAIFLLSSLIGVIYDFVVFPILFWFYDRVICKVAGDLECDAKFSLKT